MGWENNLSYGLLIGNVPANILERGEGVFLPYVELYKQESPNKTDWRKIQG